MARNGNKTIRAALPDGYSVQPGGKHHRIVGPDGEVVRWPDGRPMIIPKGQKMNQKTMRITIAELGGLQS